jgi:hypothetical protein
MSKQTITMIEIENLIVAEQNHRQDGMRKLDFSKGWQVGKFAIVANHPKEKGKYIVLDANRRVKLLKTLKTIREIPCVIVEDDVSTSAAITQAIEHHKGNELALGLVQLIDFGSDKYKYNIGRYTGKGGETAFLTDMINFYEDYHPCPSGTADDKELIKFHKGINQNVFRAISLGGEALNQYRKFAGKEDKAKGISQALRKGMDRMQASLARNESLDDARNQGQGEYSNAMANYTPSGSGKETLSDLTAQREQRAKNLMSIMACEDIDKSIKSIIGKVFATIDNGDVKGLAEWLKIAVKDKHIIIDG